MFDDDCGVWNSKKSLPTRYLYQVGDDSMVKRIFQRPGSNKYGREYKQDGKRRYDEFEKQPAAQDIIVMVRYKNRAGFKCSVCVQEYLASVH